MRFSKLTLVLATLSAAGSAIAAPVAETETKAKDPALADVLARAAQQHKGVFLDFSAVWCRPCAMLERDVFPRPEVQAALAGYIVQKYDSEVGEGAIAAERFHINQYPTMLVLTGDGDEIERMDQDPATLTKRLNELQPLSSSGHLDAATLAKSVDAIQLFAAGRQAEGRNDIPAALALYQRAEAADAAGAAGIAPSAAFRRLHVETVEAEARAHGEALIAYAGRFPGSPDALRAVTGLGALPARSRPARARLEAVAAKMTDALVAAKGTDALNQLIYSLLAVEANEAALRSAQALEKLAGDSTDLIDTVAEAYFQNGQTDKALELEARAVALAPTNKGLVANQTRFKTGKPGPVDGSPPSDPLLAEAATPELPEFIRTRQKIQADIEHRVDDHCRALVAGKGAMIVRLFVKNDRVIRGLALDPEAPKPMRTCVEKAVVGAVPVAGGLEDKATMTLRFPQHLPPAAPPKTASAAPSPAAH